MYTYIYKFIYIYIYTYVQTHIGAASRSQRADGADEEDAAGEAQGVAVVVAAAVVVVVVVEEEEEVALISLLSYLLVSVLEEMQGLGDHEPRSGRRPRGLSGAPAQGGTIAIHYYTKLYYTKLYYTILYYILHCTIV